MQIKVGESSLSLTVGDITKSNADAIVNAANSALAGGGGVDGSIHKAGGPSILAECREIVRHNGPLPTGEVVITTGGLLNARSVIHTVGPVWQGGNRHESRLLANAYRESLKLAVSHGLTTIDFPAISTGIYGYPILGAAEVALEEVCSFLSTTLTPLGVTFFLFDWQVFNIFEKVLTNKIGNGD